MGYLLPAKVTALLLFSEENIILKWKFIMRCSSGYCQSGIFKKGFYLFILLYTHFTFIYRYINQSEMCIFIEHNYVFRYLTFCCLNFFS